jgi:peptidoglycan/LPS O-acetylase OafA/YrhL
VVGCGPLWRAYFERWQLGAVPAGIANVFAVSVVSYVLARCSWVLVEQPFLRLKRFFSNEKHE